MPTQGGLAQLARALPWHGRGHRFDSDILHLILTIIIVNCTYHYQLRIDWSAEMRRFESVILNHPKKVWEKFFDMLKENVREDDKIE